MDIGSPPPAPDEPEALEPGAGRPRFMRLWIVFAMIVVLTAAAFFAIGRLTAAPAQVSDSGAEADRLFTDMMIRHHQAGVEMARAAVRLAETSKVRDFAARIMEAQTAEITALQELRGRL
ncbi:DUF305 domain-containing protein [Arthrobacter sp. 1P04PC]|uniref:DUF305 domain-containing protein n=1 Tax=unclassified Arthrobacter TaxID=235627 RepID=UPI00399FFF8D